ncbi:hypothetical protein M513_12540 [Trichuris suis]|uniref:Obg domain-containing protein n=1 Tax=Trichuris suis TaxID=68888 RepID=A0A085LNL5_9BILA|nr:hypothetical protein M513_12540 [Trichuris suis]
MVAFLRLWCNSRAGPAGGDGGNGGHVIFVEVDYQDIVDVLNRQPHELTTDELHGKQKEEKNQTMMKIRKHLRDSLPLPSYQML